MTGTGTQNDPYIPANWNELVEAAGYADVYVSLPANSTWDMNDWYTGDTPSLAAKCYEIDLNGSIIRNIYRSGDYIFRLSTSHNVIIKNGIISNIYLNNTTLFDANGDNNAMLKFVNIKIGGELYGGSLFQSANRDGTVFDMCSISLYLQDVTINSNGGGSIKKYIENTNMFLNGTVKRFANIVLKNSGIYGNLKHVTASNTTLSLQADSTVIDVALSDFVAVNYANLATSVINADKVGGATISGSGLIQATSSQMLDASWLREQGFPVV